jgi:hypothetical protein
MELNRWYLGVLLSGILYLAWFPLITFTGICGSNYALEAITIDIGILGFATLLSVMSFVSFKSYGSDWFIAFSLFAILAVGTPLTVTAIADSLGWFGYIMSGLSYYLLMGILLIVFASFAVVSFVKFIKEK